MGLEVYGFRGIEGNDKPHQFIIDKPIMGAEIIV
jgi:hypothetical protein